MEICQIKYLTSIIENDFNITRTAEKLHISQPALSKSITILESEINTQLFIRSKGRLTNLTPSGQIFYEKSKAVLTHYDELNEIIKFRSVSPGGTLAIGIPPLVITALFRNFFNQLQIDNPNVDISIIEYGASKLTEMMKELKLDISVLLSPTGLNPEEYDEIFLHEGEIAIYLSDTHPLAQKDKMTWSDLNHHDIAICDETYRTYHLFLSKLKSENIEIASLHTVNSWDYLFASIRNSNMITVFPYVSKYLFNMQGVKEIHIEDPILWKIVLTYRRKKTYSPIEKYTIDYIVNYFKSNQVTLF
ncbi:MAG: gltC 1 [Lachnospiraceae bacterium]|jgi:DNA-binding transcriptional LysR family regulator|nr:gltC 1 [Lachnospiraceae bacterium]